MYKECKLKLTDLINGELTEKWCLDSENLSDEKQMNVVDFYRKEFVAVYLENESLRKELLWVKEENALLKKVLAGDSEAMAKLADCCGEKDKKRGFVLVYKSS